MRLPKSFAHKYFHFKKLPSATHESKVARFENPIVTVKYYTGRDCTEQDYVCTCVSFQSNRGTNMISVNALEEIGLHVRSKKQRKEVTKRMYRIEMNEANEYYHGSYSS